MTCSTNSITSPVAERGGLVANYFPLVLGVEADGATVDGLTADGMTEDPDGVVQGVRTTCRRIGRGESVGRVTMAAGG